MSRELDPELEQNLSRELDLPVGTQWVHSWCTMGVQRVQSWCRVGPGAGAEELGLPVVLMQVQMVQVQELAEELELAGQEAEQGS